MKTLRLWNDCEADYVMEKNCHFWPLTWKKSGPQVVNCNYSKVLKMRFSKFRNSGNQLFRAWFIFKFLQHGFQHPFSPSKWSNFHYGQILDSKGVTSNYKVKKSQNMNSSKFVKMCWLAIAKYKCPIMIRLKNIDWV